MDKTTLDIIKIRWHIQILQEILIKTHAAAFSSATGKPPQEYLCQLVAELEAKQTQGDALLLSSAVPEDRRVLLADEYAQVLEGIKTYVTSVLKDITDS